MGRGRDRDSREERPVEPDEARSHGNDPDAVRFEEDSASGGQRTGGGRSEETNGGYDRGSDAGRGAERDDLGYRGSEYDERTREQDSGHYDETSTQDRARRGERRDESRREHEGERRGERQGRAENRSSEEDLGTSWISVIFGWLTSLGAGLILSGIVGAIAGAILGVFGVGSGTAALIGVLITLLLAFLIGGYVAGRMASRSGLKHGLLVPLLSLVIIIVLAIIGAIVGASFIDQLSGVALPASAQNAAQGIQKPQNLGTILTISGILALVMPFIGGAIGGPWGAKTGRQRP